MSMQNMETATSGIMLSVNAAISVIGLISLVLAMQPMKNEVSIQNRTGHNHARYKRCKKRIDSVNIRIVDAAILIGAGIGGLKWTAALKTSRIKGWTECSVNC